VPIAAKIGFIKRLKRYCPKGWVFLPHQYFDGVRKELTLCVLCASVVNVVVI